MTANFNTNTDNNPEWLTPPALIKALGEFDLDPCAVLSHKRPWPTAKTHYAGGAEIDGLTAPWFGRVWLNPPYGRETFKWLDKLAAHGSGVALIFARTETKGFHKTIWQKAHAVFFFEGRLSFYYANGDPGAAANAPSCLVAYSMLDAEAIAAANQRGDIKGQLIYRSQGVANVL